MTGLIQALKSKGLWIVIFFTFVYILYSVHRLNAVNFSIPYVSCDAVACKKNLSEVNQERSHAKRYLDSNENTIKQNSTNHAERTTTQNLAGFKISKEDTYIENNTVNGINPSMNIGISLAKTSNTRIGILVPSTTRNIKYPLLDKLSLITICLPSIYKTMQIEYAYTIYVGIGRGDYLETVINKLESMFDRVKVVVTTGKSFTKTVNALARTAYRDGMDYLVRINDDTTFETNNWTSEGLDVLQNYTPPNIGVVGPTCHEGNTAILTHDMVHRTHLEIFDFYYPPYFDNWWADDWITNVYKPGRSSKLQSWVVKHHLKSHGTRYHVDFKKQARLNKTLAFDRERLAEHLLNLQL